MERLKRHILSLLRLYDKIALPGVGFFIFEYKSANIDFKQNALSAPIYRINFVKGDTGVDHKLLESYKVKEKLSHLSASNLLIEDTEKFKREIENNNFSFIDDLNSLFYSYPQISFKTVVNSIEEPEEGKQLNPHVSHPGEIEASKSLNSGLKTSEIEENAKEDYSGKNIISSNSLERAEESTIPHLEESYRNEVHGEKREKEKNHFIKNPDYYYIPIHKKLANVAACLLLVVIVWMCTYFPLNPGGTGTPAASIIPIQMDNEIPIKESVEEQNINPPVENDSLENNEVKQDSAMLIYEDLNKINKYHAIVAAFKSKTEAENFISNYKNDKQRFDVIKKSKFYLISAASASDKDSLETNMPLIKSEYPEAWILVIQ